MSAIGSESIADRARTLLEPILARDGFELVEVEWGREGSSWVLRLFVDRPGGVTIDHCQELSRTVEPIIDREGFELVEVDWGREGPAWVLRIFVDRPGGVTIDHCQELSRIVEPILDVEDFIEPSDNLEVSSPGLDRPLRKPADFERFAGQRAHVKAYGPIDTPAGPRKNWSGTLKGFKDGAVEVEWAREGSSWVLRLFVDRPGGVTIDHCQELSRTIEPILDVEDFIEPAYNLEVSSPGVDRPLRKPKDFERFAGQRAHVKTYGPIESAPAGSGAGPRKNWTGTLRGFADGAVLVDVDGVLHRIPHDQIAKAHLEYDVEADLRRKD